MSRLRIYTVLALALFISPAIYGQINVKDSLLTILQNEVIEPENRFIAAYNLLFFNSSPEEAEALGLNIVYPFVKKTWNSQSEQLGRLARLQLMVSFCHRERGGEDKDEKERLFAEKALATALKSENNAACARCYLACGFMEIKRGDVKRGHEYLYQAIAYYDKMEQYVKSSEMLYVIAANFHEIKDTDGLQRVLQQMEECLQKDTSKQSQYQHNVIKHNYFDLLLEKEKRNNGTTDYHLVDSMMIYIQKNIDLVENFLRELSPNWMHGYAYYFLAKALDDYYPKQTTSIFLYLDKAIEMMEREWLSRTQESAAGKEFKIYINTIRAKALSRKGKMQESYKVMNEALLLLNELKDDNKLSKDYNNLSVHRHTAYQFMADYYEKINRPAEALKYQKLLQESEAQRYESEKIQAINEMSAKYETEKKEIRIQTLVKEYKTTQRILWLTIGLSVALLTAFLLIFLSSRLKRKNVEQQLYEMALLAELRQNELEKIQNLKQELEQSPVKNTIEKISWLVEDSIIEKNTKKTYLERLSKIDAKLLEQAYQSSKAKITGMDMKYIICFSADIDVKDISLLFNVEPASVHTVRYRIKKKFSKEDSFRAVL